MKIPFHVQTSLTVNLLTLALASLLSGCSLIWNEHYSTPCNSHAYTRLIVTDYISTRYHSNAPVRTAVIPFSVPANLSAYDAERPGLGNELAWKVQAELLHSGGLPIVEVLNRQDWPGKKEEFFTGNFGAIAQAREAGYDLLLVGYLESIRSADSLAVYTKLIESESGMTIWYGRTEISTIEPDEQRLRSFFRVEDRRPSALYLAPMVDRLSQCLAQAITSESDRGHISS
jgi:hypothetical protein